MKELLRTQTEKSPEINFSPTGLLRIKGISVIENIHEFYNEVLSWLNEFSRNPPAKVHLIFEIEYLNTSSTKMCVTIARRVAELETRSQDVRITWRYQEEDEDMLELGKEVEYFSGTDFVFDAFD